MADQSDAAAFDPESKKTRGSRVATMVGFGFKYLTVLGGVLTFCWAAYTYLDQREMENRLRRIEASKPFLEKDSWDNFMVTRGVFG